MKIYEPTGRSMVFNHIHVTTIIDVHVSVIAFITICIVKNAFEFEAIYENVYEQKGSLRLYNGGNAVFSTKINSDIVF